MVPAMIKLRSLETDITTVCQNSCAGCDHMIPLAKKRTMMKPAAFQADLDVMKRLVHSEKYGILGGEPTLHPQLVEILTVLKDAHITDKIQLWTNGQSFDDIPDEVFGIINELVWSVYPSGKVTASGEDRARVLCAKHGVIFSALQRGDYFKVPLHAHTSTYEEARDRYRTCVLKVCGHVILNGYFYVCCLSPSIHVRLLRMPEGADGISLEDITEDQIKAFIEDPEPPKSCYRCRAYQGRQFHWHEVKGAKAWLAESME